MRLLSLIVASLASGALAVYVLTCSVNDAPPAPVHPIVGKWQYTMIAGHPVSPLVISTHECTADGMFINESRNPKHHYRRSTGTYVISGNQVMLTYDDRPEHQRYWSYHIVSVTDDELVTMSGEQDQVPSEVGKSIRLKK